LRSDAVVAVWAVWILEGLRGGAGRNPERSLTVAALGARLSVSEPRISKRFLMVSATVAATAAAAMEPSSTTTAVESASAAGGSRRTVAPTVRRT